VTKVKLYKGGVLKLPAEVRRELGLKDGDVLLVTVEGGVIKLLPVDLVDPVEAYSSELGVWMRTGYWRRGSGTLGGLARESTTQATHWEGEEARAYGFAYQPACDG